MLFCLISISLTTDFVTNSCGWENKAACEDVAKGISGSEYKAHCDKNPDARGDIHFRKEGKRKTDVSI